MPKFYQIQHNTPEWEKARLGIPTASGFKNIITAAKGTLSKSHTAYQDELIAELMTGYSEEDFTSAWMQRGHDLEADARMAYQIETGNAVKKGIFVTDDLGRFGASPDGAITDKNAGIEIKCPKAKTHMGYLLGEGLDDYKQQWQGQMLVAGWDYIHFFSYHPDLPPALHTIEADLDYQAKMLAALEEFHEGMQEKIQRLKDMGHSVPQKTFDKQLEIVR